MGHESRRVVQQEQVEAQLVAPALTLPVAVTHLCLPAALAEMPVEHPVDWALVGAGRQWLEKVTLPVLDRRLHPASGWVGWPLEAELSCLCPDEV